MSVFFISYKRESMAFAKEVKRHLENQGLIVWLDDDSMLGGDEWKQIIDNVLKECIAVIVIVTPEALGSQYVTYEWSFALGCGKRVIPIIREFPDPNNPKHPKMHPRLDDKQYRDFTNPDDATWERLIRELQIISAKDDIPADVKEAQRRISDPNPDTRHTAIDWLLAYENVELVIEIFALCAQSKSTEVKMDCAFALAQLDPIDVRAIPGLMIGAARGNRRQFALTVLAQMNTQEAIAALEQLFANGANESWRPEIARAMSKVTNPLIIPILIRITESVVIMDVLDALGRFGDARAIPVLKDWIMRRGVVSGDEKRRAIAALGEIHDPSIPDLLIEIFQKFLPDPHAPENNLVCSAAMNAAATIGGDIGTKILMEMRELDARFMAFYNIALGELINKRK